MIGLSLKDAAEAMGARIINPDKAWLKLDSQFPEVSIDTRTLRPGQCYFALRGARMDGHDFIRVAMLRGATIIIASQASPAENEARILVLRVEDTTKALQDLARKVRVKWGGPLLAVTGSAGKTTTRRFTSALLGRRFNVHQSPANFNNHIGVPLTLAELDSGHDFAVQELGMNHAGEIRELGKICRPDAALVTNVAPAHTENFDSLDQVAEAKAEVLESLPEKGRFFYNADDERVQRMADGFRGETIGFSLQADCDVRIANPEFRSYRETHFELQAQGKRVAAKAPFTGMHNLYNVAAAAAVSLGYGISPEEAADEISRLELSPMRGNILELEGAPGSDPITVWDDSYNSNPKALDSVLDMEVQLSQGHQSSQAEFKPAGRRILVLGDMLELGADSTRFHLAAGARVAANTPDLLVTVGPEAAHLGEGARDAGLPDKRIARFVDSLSAAAYVAKTVLPGDFVLVKGSRGVGMERIVEALRQRTRQERREAREEDGGSSPGRQSLVAVLMALTVQVSALVPLLRKLFH